MNSQSNGPGISIKEEELSNPPPDIPLATTETTNGNLNVPSPAVPSDPPMMADSPQPAPTVEQALPAQPVIEQQQPQPTVVSAPLSLNMAGAVSSSVPSSNVSNVFYGWMTFLIPVNEFKWIQTRINNRCRSEIPVKIITKPLLPAFVVVSFSPTDSKGILQNPFY